VPFELHEASFTSLETKGVRDIVSTTVTEILVALRNSHSSYRSVLDTLHLIVIICIIWHYLIDCAAKSACLRSIAWPILAEFALTVSNWSKKR
jgi:hypothetical protein